MATLDKYALIIFDCDGTLVDSERLSNQLISDMMNEIGIEMSEEKSLKLFKGTHFKHITDYVHEHAPNNIDYDFEPEFRRRCKVLFEEQLTEVNGASTFIQNLRSDYCVASNGPQIKMQTSLKVTGLIEYLNQDQIFSAYDINKFKPEPDLFLYSAAQRGFRHKQCLVIEDTVPGIQAAMKADMDVWTIHHKGINDEILEFDIPSFTDFTEIKI